MKISNTNNYINQTYTSQAAKPQNTQPPVKPPEETLAGTADSINLSSTTRDMQKIASASENTPPERKQLVQDLKEQVQSNRYTVNAEQVAEKMIGSIMDEVG